ncbi:probable polygalacturonase [Tanacetum coccineum]
MVETLTLASTPSIWRSHRSRWITNLITSYKTLLAVLWIVVFTSFFIWQRNVGSDGFMFFKRGVVVRRLPVFRPVVVNITDFGGVGDGVTVNTVAFERAVFYISKVAKKGGGQLNVPAGKWLTAPFNLTSHMTLFLAQDAVILAVDDEKVWPLLPPLPSYGYGREHPGPRYGSFIHGQNLRDVVITGHNGTIDGQGLSWWKKYRQKEAPNTDGIDPDSCEDMLIEDCYISVGDDAIAIKSGWDQYGVAYGKPSKNILIRNLVVQSMVSAGISIGSEMSGGVSNVTIENVLVFNSRRAVRIKTAAGRGAYIRDITYKNLTFDNVRVGIIIKTDYNEHPDAGFDPKAFPIIRGISYSSIHGEGVRVPVRIHGSADIPVRNVTFRDMSVGITYKKKHIFQCAYVSGRVIGSIFPKPCENLDLYDEKGSLVKKSVSENASDIDYDI